MTARTPAWTCGARRRCRWCASWPAWRTAWRSRWRGAARRPAAAARCTSPCRSPAGCRPSAWSTRVRGAARAPLRAAACLQAPVPLLWVAVCPQAPPGAAGCGAGAGLSRSAAGGAGPRQTASMGPLLRLAHARRSVCKRRSAALCDSPGCSSRWQGRRGRADMVSASAGSVLPCAAAPVAAAKSAAAARAQAW